MAEKNYVLEEAGLAEFIRRYLDFFQDDEEVIVSARVREGFITIKSLTEADIRTIYMKLIPV